MKASTLEFIFILFTILLWVLIILTPFLIARYLKCRSFLKFLLLTFFLTFVFSIVAVYWSSELYKQIIYGIYGFEEYGMDDYERLQNVSQENQEAIKAMYNNSFGIGWPVKLILGYIIFVIPYNLISCYFIHLFRRRKKLVV